MNGIRKFIIGLIFISLMASTVMAATPTVTVDEPNGGETLCDNVTITATVSDDVSVINVTFSYSSDNGDNWESIDKNTTRTGNSYSSSWDTTQVSDGIQYLIKATATYNNNETANDTSDNTFSIANNHSATFESGNRIWDESADMNETYIWTPQSFSGFYYDLDTNEGSETLTIKNIGGSLSKGDIIYETSPIPVEFEYEDWGTYDVIGFMADRYFVGYNETSFASSSDNLLYEEKLSKVLTDNDKRYNLKAGSTLELEEGYEFRITELSTGGDAVQVGLFKDNEIVMYDVVSEDDDFVYEKDLGKAKDMPILALHIETVFSGMETSTVVVEGIFQISEHYIDVDRGDKFGEMELTGVSSSGITMENGDSVSLDEGDDFNLMGKINIVVADDSDTLRFAPYVDMSEPGTYELRGTVTEEEEFDWTPFNFEALLYDIDTGDGDETLNLMRSGRTVDDNELTYTTKPINMKFEHSDDGWNEFQSIGFLGNTYFAGYKEDSSFISSDISLIEDGKLSKILIDEDKKYTLHIGNSLSLQEGYSVRIDLISLAGDTLMFTILKDGEEISTGISSGEDTFVYEVEVDDTDIPIFIIHIDQVFSGMETNSIFIDGIFQISESFTTVEKGDSYGIMEVTSTSSSEIVLKNDNNSFTLGEGDTISIMNDIKIKVADDNNEVRFYPFQEIIVENPLYLELDIPNNVYQNEELTIKVTYDGDEIKGAAITFGNISVGTTDSSGELTYTPTESGTFTITASMEDYVSDDEDIEVLYQPKLLTIGAPLLSDSGESIVISVTSDGAGINGASVKFGSKDLGTTPASGNITYTPDEIGTFTISASKSGYQDATKDIDIADPDAKLVFSNLTIEPKKVEPGENVNITVEAANFAIFKEVQTMYLKVNGENVTSQDLVLDPGETMTIHFNLNMPKSGTYLVEVDGCSDTFKVTGLVFNSINPSVDPGSYVGVNQIFSVDTNETMDFIWYIDGVQDGSESSATTSSYSKKPANVGEYNVTVIANNSNGTIFKKWTWKVDPKTFNSGNRIWDESANMSDTYTWNSLSFSGFYYDLDTDEGSETLTIEDIDRSLSKGDIIYETSPIPVEFEYEDWGTYDVIGFMADRYFTGYSGTSFASSSDNLLNEEKLSKVLTDNDKRYNVKAGSTLKLEEGYEFRITELSTGGDAVMVGLFKDGEKVMDDVVSEDDDFVYEKDLGKAKDMPILALHIETVFSGMKTSTVVVEGIFQISENSIDVDRNDKFGEMKVTRVSSSGITMENKDSVSLGEGDDFNLMGKINIVVADDSDTLRFAPYVDMSKPGTYELRGTVTGEEEFDWTPFNFEALLYDIDTGDGDETLNLIRSGRTVDDNELTYTTKPIDMKFEHSGDGWNEFQSIGFMGDTYFAGYKSDSSFISSDRSLIEEGKLSKILIDEDKKYTLHIGNSLPLQEGYSVRLDQISRDGDSLMFTILKDGEEMSTEISSGEDTFVYEVEVGDTDIPIIIIHIDQVFSGMKTNSVFIDGIFQISESFTTVEKGDSYGIMEVTSTSSSEIVLKNDNNSFTLGEGDTISIMNDIKIKVADSGTVRFYPFQEIIV